jgi:hypothetical protein
MMERKLVGLDAIRIDGGTQSREKINDAIVSEYADLIADGTVFPAVRVYFDGVKHYLADGFHRYHAHRKAGKGAIEADVISGTLREAILYSLGANDSHGLRRTNADKHKAVMTMLQDFEWQEYTNVEIARICRCSPSFVAKLRGDDAPAVRTFTMADGTVVKKDFTNVGKKAAPKPEPVIEEPIEDNESEHDEMVAELVAENERVNDRLAVAAWKAQRKRRPWLPRQSKAYEKKCVF